MSLDIWLTCDCCNSTTYDANITHNLAVMAAEAGIYTAVWRPIENGYETAGQIIEPLRVGIALMKADPARFIPHNASNGWGTYDQFLPWLDKLLAACERAPSARVSVSR